MPIESLISRTIDSLVNGISQQPAAIRLKSQGATQENCLSDVVEGVERRPPTEHLAGPAAEDASSNLPNSLPAQGVFVHVIDRGSAQQQHIMILEDGDVQVYDLDGATVTVNDNGAAGSAGSYTYLDIGAAQAEDSFEALTVLDFTFIINKTKTVAMSGNSGGSSTIQRTQTHEFLYNVGPIPVSGSGVGIVIAGTSTGAFSSTNDSVAVAGLIMNALTGATTGTDAVGIGAYTNWRFTKEADRTWIYGYQFQGALETVEGTDTYGTTIGKLFATGTGGEDATAQSFSELPDEAPDGFIIRIAGSEGNSSDDWYVVYDDEEHVWRETAAPALDNEFDADTMPHTLTWTGSDYNFQPATWADREKGDTVSAPEPSFVGAEIKDLVLHKNRLTILADENVIASESLEFFNFWPTTVTTSKASDPIDVSASGNVVNLLDYGVPFQRNLTLFSAVGGTQQELVGSDVEDLTVENARVEERTQYAMADVRPAAIGQALYFLTTRNQFSGLLEYTLTDFDRASADDVSAHVPEYIPSDIRILAGSTAENMIVLVPNGASDDHQLYVYRFWFIGGNKVQSSWSRWSFNEEDQILGADWIDSTLYLVIKRDDGLHLEKMDFRSTEDGGLGYRVHLDSLVTVTGTYAAVGDTTTFALPYDPAQQANSSWKVVKTSNWSGEEGEEITGITVATDTITVPGDFSDADVLIGRVYESSYSPSEVILDEGRQTTPGGAGLRPILSGRLQLRRWSVLFKDTLAFTARVSYAGDTTTYDYDFTTYDVNDPLAAPTPETGVFDFHVGGRSKDVTITILSEGFAPFTLSNMEWEGLYYSRSDRA